MEERIKESELAKEDHLAASATERDLEQGDVIPKKKDHKVRKLIKEMWPAYLIEIFVIVLGISITLVLEEWRDHSKESQLEKIYHRNLLADINTDLPFLQYAIDSTHQLLNKGNELLGFIKSPSEDPIVQKRVYTALQGILERPDFISSDATFSDLKNSGNMRLLTDINLKNLLFAYYSQAQNIKETQEAEQQTTIIISGSYLLKRFPMGELANQPLPMSPGELKDLSKTFEFSNNVLLRISNRKELLEKYEKERLLGIRLKELLSSKATE